MLKQQLAQFNHIMQGIERIYEDYAKSVGLTYMTLTVLSILWNRDTPCTQKEICDLSHYNKQIVNVIVKAFYERGYLTLREVPGDRRNKHILFTEEGRTYARSVMDPLWDLEQQALSVLSQEERTLLLSLLGRCYGGYQEAADSVQKSRVFAAP